MRPTELRVSKDRRLLTIRFEDGNGYEIPAELLRIASPSAEVRGHGAGDAKLVSGKRKVTIVNMEPVGRYAVRITFDDGHNTGLYQWAYLAELGSNSKDRMAAYEAKLTAAGKSRDL